MPQLLDILIKVAPVCVVLGYGWLKEIKEKKELQQYIIQSDKENLKTLNNLSKFLETIINTQKNDKDDIHKKIEDQANVIKSHIDTSILKINTRRE